MLPYGRRWLAILRLTRAPETWAPDSTVETPRVAVQHDRVADLLRRCPALWRQLSEQDPLPGLGPGGAGVGEVILRFGQTEMEGNRTGPCANRASSSVKSASFGSAFSSAAVCPLSPASGTQW